MGMVKPFSSSVIYRGGMEEKSKKRGEWEA